MNPDPIYFSLNQLAPTVSFSEALIRGLAPDRGLYFPEAIRPLEPSFFENIHQYSRVEIAFTAIRQFIGSEIKDETLKTIIAETINFDFPLVELAPGICSLELFHGPTLAFKDVGARFMARCLAACLPVKEKGVTILVATSGDTGGAVADGFLGVEGVEVVILYPKGKVSPVQQAQLTTLGQNIRALEVDGTFDDCQAMVKQAFMDPELNQVMNLSSANSINIARWLPQMFYYFFAYQQLQDKTKPVIVSVPSGNFGNIAAGLMAKRLGLPIKSFVAATNANKTVVDYLRSGIYLPQAAQATISNAMDVGDPSNFIRISELFKGDREAMKKQLKGFSYTDEQTKEAMRELYRKYNYIADPHGAVAYLGLKAAMAEDPDAQGLFLETAHPCKFPSVPEVGLDEQVDLPPAMEALLKKEQQMESIGNTYEDLKAVFAEVS